MRRRLEVSALLFVATVVLAAPGSFASVQTTDPYLAGPGRKYVQDGPPARYPLANSFFDVFVEFDLNAPADPPPPTPYYGPPLSVPDTRRLPISAELRTVSVTLPSPPGGNVYRLDSFFDIFIEQVSPGAFASEIQSGTLNTGDFLLRESPTRMSLGQTVVTPIGNGAFRIDSFFDIFTEISFDGGQSWIPDSNPSGLRVTLVPEPHAVACGSIASMALLAPRRRRA